MEKIALYLAIAAAFFSVVAVQAIQAGQPNVNTINITFVEPDGQTVTKGEMVIFLAATYDGGMGALTPNVEFFAAGPQERYFQCEPVHQIGANAFRCVLEITPEMLPGDYTAYAFAIQQSYRPAVAERQLAFRVE